MNMNENVDNYYYYRLTVVVVVIDMVDMDAPAGTLFFMRDPDGYTVEFSYGQPLGAGYGPS